MASKWLTARSALAGALVALGLLAAVVTLPLGADPGGVDSERSIPVADTSAVTATDSPSASVSSPTLHPSVTPTDAPVTGLEIGNRAPDFELPKPDGGTLRLSETRGNPVWINFWAPWCPACRTEMPRLEGFWLEHRADGLIVLGVGVRDSPDAFRTYAADLGVSYPLVMDVDGHVAEQYRAIALPVHYWLDGDGIVRDWAFGELPPDLLAASLERILTSATPTR